MEIVRLAQAYFEQPSPKEESLVGFETYPNGSANFIIWFGSPVGHILIKNIDTAIIASLVDGLSRFRNFGIFLAYGTEKTNLIDPHTFHMFRSEIVVDNDIVTGKDTIKVNWNELI